MSLPREVLPNRFYLMTRRCTQQLFLMRPDAETTNAFLYCLALAASMFNITVLLSCAMSNHHHTVIFDRDGLYPQFLEYFHKLFARSQNALRGRRENFWSTQQASVVRLLTPADVMSKLIYTALNPVTANLVEHATDWPGANTYAELIAGREITIERPKHFFREKGPTPESVTLRCEIPAELGVRVDAFLGELRGSVESAERRMIIARQRERKSVLGARAVVRQAWSSSPATAGRSARATSRSSTINPRIAAKDQSVREEALVRNQEFIEAYRRARRGWLRRQRVEFPPGTYWLQRFARVRVARS